MKTFNLTRLLCCLATASILFAAQAATSDNAATGSVCNIIPVPAHIQLDAGTFTLPEQGAKVFIQGAPSSALAHYIQNSALRGTSVKSRAKADVAIVIGGKASKRIAQEGYNLTVSPKRIDVVASTEQGAFYAIQTLLQMTQMGELRTIDCCTVADEPRFLYRGLHFDVSRHFFSKEFLIKQIDAMALLKLNRMHLHLTDGAGWRLQIDRYPRLTSYAAWRPAKTWQEWAKCDTKYCDQNDPNAHGGFYTKDDIREVLAYAESRHITVIPEIEMPGHSEEAVAAYPEVSCDGTGKGGDFCPGKEATFQFLENILSEVIDLFPSHYIHIGGDEAGKSAWKTCPDCQRRMKEEGLNSLDELQSYLIRRIEKFVNSKGRDIIGWDEILEGGLAPNATVMSWRGTSGGIKAIKAGHDVVMTPGELYLDHTQDAPFKEPMSIGGYGSLQVTYDFNPVDPSLTQQELKHLLGVQANLWTEYVPTPEHAEYMYYPRTFAVAETGWSRAEDKNYEKFRPRAVVLCNMLQKLGYNTFDLSNEYGNRRESLQPVQHLAKGCKVTYQQPFSKAWPSHGATTLTDGELGGWTYADHKWQGLLKDLDVVIDLGKLQPVHYVGATFMHLPGPGVYVPRSMQVEVSADGKNYESIGTLWNDIDDKIPDLLFKTFSLTCNRQARYVRVHAVNGKEFIFVDEIIVN
ncbi:MAG: family 20 glycosylhydrolase [Muribaculaceae bacterium]